MHDTLFQINNLNCEYLKGVPVLKIKHLELPKGKLIFVVGRSGIGKSTFIETLGLMNRTIVKHEQTTIQFRADQSNYTELRDSWSWDNEKLSAFRRTHFSFVFQNTNLMPNFTSGENMMISLLIKGKNKTEARKEVLEVMAKLSLSADIFDKKITEVSGGQRQRLAFVRAITADFTVLFGDEPTGNLDERTAIELMTILKSLIRDRNRAGIIVSHDLNLASQFADMIIPITAVSRSDGTMMGEVLQQNIIHKTADSWEKLNGDKVGETIVYLNHFLSNDYVVL